MTTNAGDAAAAAAPTSLLATSFTAFLSALAATILISALRRASRRRRLLSRLLLAPGSSGWLHGHLPALLAPDFHRLMCRWERELGNPGLYAVALPLGDRGVVVTDPAAVAAVLGAASKEPSFGGGEGGDEKRQNSAASRAAPLPKYSHAYGVLDALWGGSASLFTVPERTPRWAAVRKGLSPAFSGAAARGSLRGVAAAAAELCDSLLQCGVVATAAAGDRKEEKEGKEKAVAGEGKSGGSLDGFCDPSLVVLSSSHSPSSPSSSSSLSITVNADALGMRLALAAVGRATLGADFGAADAGKRCAPVAALAVALPEAQAAMTNPLRLFSRDGTAKRAAAARAEFRGAVLEASKSLQEKAGSGEKDEASSSSQLPAAARALAAVLDPKTGKPLSLSALAAEVGTLVMGGFETTGHVLAFALLRVAACARAQRGAERELRAAGLLNVSSTSSSSSSAVPPPPPRLPCSADLRNLPYLLAVAKEALRLHPTVPGVPRMATRDVTLPLTAAPTSSSSSSSASAVVVPAGTFVYALTRHAQRSRREWGPDALEFRPERWLEAEAEAEAEEQGQESGKKEEARRPFYAPFSLGPRDCAGKTLALVTLHTALAVVCSRFELAEVEGTREGGGEVVEGKEKGREKDDAGKVSPSPSPSPIDLPEKIALTAHPARPLLKLIPR